MAHLTYPSTGLSGVLLQQADLQELQQQVQAIRNFLDQNIAGAYQTLLSNLPNLASTNVSSLRDAIARYNAIYAGQEIEHGNTTPPDPPPEPSPLLKEFGQYDVAQVDRQIVTSGLFSNGAGTLTTFHTASLLGDTSASYVEIYNADPDSDSTAQVQFAVGYAHINGSGSIGNTTKTTSGNRETAALYRQFRNVILAPNTNKFTFTAASPESSSGYDDFYFLAFNRAQMREKVDPGNWELRLTGTGAGGKEVYLIDDSGATTNTDVNISGRVFNVVSGSLKTGTAVTKRLASAETIHGAPGLFYPDLGIILLNPEWLYGNAGVDLAPGRSANTLDNNPQKLFTAISSSLYFAARREEEISSVSYFTRARNDEFNFSSNPTYKTGSKDSDGVETTGKFKVASFKGDPRAYITQVGLYDDDHDLIAVAKLSQPVLKSFSREAVIKVKLDY
jgi:hypothetical protein